jgi:hypothetical protein
MEFDKIMERSINQQTYTKVKAIVDENSPKILSIYYNKEKKTTKYSPSEHKDKEKAAGKSINNYSPLIQPHSSLSVVPHESDDKNADSDIECMPIINAKLLSPCMRIIN